MSYDELLELGEDIGDVKQERWRIEGRAVVSALRVVTYEAKADQAGKDLQLQTVVLTLVCRPASFS